MSAAVLQNCPVCSRVLYFSHSDTTLLQCACGSTLYRENGAITAKAFYTVNAPVDLIQPGTEGVWNDKAFRVIGRIKAWVEEFVFNYWTIVWSDGRLSFLGEGYGLYVIYEPIVTDRNLSAALLDGVDVGSKRDLFKDDSFVLERKYRCYKWELEGEAWLPQAPLAFRTFEFAALDGRRIEAIEVDRNIILTFQVHYTSLDALQLKQTRSADAPVRLQACNHCGKENALHGFPFCQSFACLYCGTRHALQNGTDFKQLGQRNVTDVGPDIEIGATGVLHGINYEVIGYAQKEEANQYRSQWKEYTLFHPHHGFAFLSEYNGHWIFVKERGDAPVLDKETTTSFIFQGERFELYNGYGYELVDAKGEFPYNAFNDAEKKAKEFISPPEVWIQEKSGREGIVWFLGEHLPQGELKEAFGGKLTLPWKSGVGAVEPKGYVGMGKIARIGFGAVLLLLLVHILTSFTHRNQPVAEETYAFDGAADTLTYVKKNIVLDKWRSNLQFDISADVDNSWCEVSGTLVDVVKGTEYSFEQGVEYYHGYSDGESWAEGSKQETAYLNSVPAGRYDLIIRGLRESKVVYSAMGAAPSYTPALTSIFVKTSYDTTSDRNFFLCLIPLVLFPVVHFLVVRNNERRRWHNSPFSPYTYNE